MYIMIRSVLQNEKSQDRVFGMMLEAIKSLKHDKKKAG